jgi:hypothetical protein
MEDQDPVSANNFTRNINNDVFNDESLPLSLPNSFDVFLDGLAYTRNRESKKFKNPASNIRTINKERCISENDLANLKLNDVKTSSPLRRAKLNSDNTNDSKSTRTSLSSFKFDDDECRDKVVFNTTYNAMNTDDAQLEQECFHQNMKKLEAMPIQQGMEQLDDDTDGANGNLNSTYSLPADKKTSKHQANCTILITGPTRHPIGNDIANNNGLKKLTTDSSSASASSLSSIGSTVSVQSSVRPSKPVQQQIPVKSSIPRVLKPPTVFRSSPTASQKAIEPKPSPNLKVSQVHATSAKSATTLNGCPKRNPTEIISNTTKEKKITHVNSAYGYTRTNGATNTVQSNSDKK